MRGVKEEVFLFFLCSVFLLLLRLLLCLILSFCLVLLGGLGLFFVVFGLELMGGLFGCGMGFWRGKLL